MVQQQVMRRLLNAWQMKLLITHRPHTGRRLWLLGCHGWMQLLICHIGAEAHNTCSQHDYAWMSNGTQGSNLQQGGRHMS